MQLSRILSKLQLHKIKKY